MMMAAPLAPFYPTPELVAVAWFGQRVAGLVPGQVATALPKDVTAWADQGFVQLTAIPNAVADVDVPQWRRSVFQADYWANTPGSAKPPWNLAARLPELVREATGDPQSYGSAVVLPEGYLGARVQAVYFLSEPARVLDDPAGYARFTNDVAVDWVRA